MPASEQSPNLSIWSDKWSASRTNWHSPEAHPSLLCFGHLVGLPKQPTHTTPTSSDQCEEDDDEEKNKKGCQDDLAAKMSKSADGKRVFVPLCGKSVDLAYFALHPNVSQVVGLDGIEKSLQVFQEEQPHLDIHPQEPQTSNDSETGPPSSAADTLKFRRWVGTNIELLQGDYFDLTLEDLSIVASSSASNKEENSKPPRFDLIFDRGSIVAIEPSLRQQYLDIQGKLIQPKTGQIFLVVVERADPTDTRGPPFAMYEPDVRALYEAQSWVGSVVPLDGNECPDQLDNEVFVSTYYLVNAK